MKNTNNPYLTKYITIILIAVAIVGCVKEYAVPGTKYNDMVVIDGLLTDQGEAVVKISHSYKQTQIHGAMGTGAVVSICDAKGQILTLAEDTREKGTYRADATPLNVCVGNSYQLTVRYAGNTYQSSSETMLSAPTIDKLGYVSAKDNDGVWVIASTTGNDDGGRYFAWTFDETWKILTPIISSRPIHHSICYANQMSAGIYLSSTATARSNQLIDERVYLVDYQSPRLGVRYSSLVTIYSLSRDTYTYLEQVKKVNNENGGLFDPIPFSMLGNIASSDASVPVIGNFQASASAQKRLYIDRLDLAQNTMVDWGMKLCEMQCAGGKMIDSLVILGWSIIDTVGPPCGTRMSNSLACFDCVTTGASDIAPSWWEERPSPIK